MEKVYFTMERRRANMERIVSQIQDVRDLDFNSLIFAFLDIIHSSFLAGLFAGKSKEEREQLEQQMQELNNRLVDVLNENSTNLACDMIVLCNLMMDAIENAMQLALKDAENK